MIAGKRFDYFPRGIDEVWLEIEKNRSDVPEIVVEENLCLYYPLPYYYFVNKNNNKLADRIKRGLQIAGGDGSFKRLFLKYHEKFVRNANLSNRLVFSMKNPNLSEGTKEPDTSWWLDQKK